MYKTLLSSITIGWLCGISAWAQEATATSATPTATTILSASDEAARIPADRPVTIPDAGLLAAIGMAAHDSIEKMQNAGSIDPKIQLLINLAEAEIRAGDIKGARDALVEARSTPQLPVSFAADLFVQSFLAGDTGGAMEFIQKFPATVQVGAFGKMAVTQTKDGDVAGADRSIGLIDALYDKTPREPAAQVWDPSREPNFQDSHDRVLSDIAKILARKGDISHAQALAVKISNKGSLSDVLAEIAKAQHKSGDQHAADRTLRPFKPDVEEFYGKDAQQVARLEAVAFGVAGDIKDARAIADAIPSPDKRDLVLSQLAQALAENGDTVHARETAVAAGDDPDDLIVIGNREHDAGNDTEARHSLLAAHEALKKQASLASGDRLTLVSRIVDGLISAGAFSEAMTISMELDDLNRRPHILGAIGEEMKRGDTQAIRETAPVALKVAETGPMIQERDLTASADNTAEVIRLIQQALAGNDPQTAIGQALALMGNNAQMLEPLMFITALSSPGRQKRNVADVPEDFPENRI